jgi:hypothetical protein
MIDPFVILAPVLLLAVVALLRFVGCATLLGIDDVAYAPAQQPVITGINPPSVTADTPAFNAGFDLTVTGTNFVSDSKVHFGGTVKMPTSPPTATQMTVRITPADVASAGFVDVTVFNPGSGGGTSSPLTFKVLVVVTFSPPPTPNPGPLTVPFDNLDFGPFASGGWAWGPPSATAPGTFNNISFDSGTNAPDSRDFKFVNGPRTLDSIRVFSENVTGPGSGTGSITLRGDGGLTTSPLQITGGASPVTVNTGWTQTQSTTTVTVSFTVGSYLGIDTITYIGPK